MLYIVDKHVISEHKYKRSCAVMLHTLIQIVKVKSFQVYIISQTLKVKFFSIYLLSVFLPLTHAVLDVDGVGCWLWRSHLCVQKRKCSEECQVSMRIHCAASALLFPFASSSSSRWVRLFLLNKKFCEFYWGNIIMFWIVKITFSREQDTMLTIDFILSN